MYDNHLGYFCKKLCHRELSKVAQPGHTGIIFPLLDCILLYIKSAFRLLSGADLIKKFYEIGSSLPLQMLETSLQECWAGWQGGSWPKVSASSASGKRARKRSWSLKQAKPV